MIDKVVELAIMDYVEIHQPCEQEQISWGINYIRQPTVKNAMRKMIDDGILVKDVQSRIILGEPE